MDTDGWDTGRITCSQSKKKFVADKKMSIMEGYNFGPLCLHYQTNTFFFLH